VVLDERERDGITIDSCPKCRGIWLDRGELERLVAKAAQAMDEEVAERSPRASSGSVPAHHEAIGRRDHDDDDDDDRRRYAERGGYPPRRKRWFEVFDIFD
jgi:hypothetical protein